MLARVIAIATCLSVRLSVTCRYCVKTQKASVMILHHLVVLRGSTKKGGVRKFSDFLALSINISKTVADTAKVTISD